MFISTIISIQYKSESLIFVFDFCFGLLLYPGGGNVIMSSGGGGTEKSGGGIDRSGGGGMVNL